MDPFRAANPEHSSIDWDYETVKRIVLEHHLGPLVEG